MLQEAAAALEGGAVSLEAVQEMLARSQDLAAKLVAGATALASVRGGRKGRAEPSSAPLSQQQQQQGRGKKDRSAAADSAPPSAATEPLPCKAAAADSMPDEPPRKNLPNASRIEACGSKPMGKPQPTRAGTASTVVVNASCARPVSGAQGAAAADGRAVLLGELVPYVLSGAPSTSSTAIAASVPSPSPSAAKQERPRKGDLSLFLSGDGVSVYGRQRVGVVDDNCGR